MKNLTNSIALLLISILFFPLNSSSQIEGSPNEVQSGKVVLRGNFINTDNVKCHFYKFDQTTDSWIRTHTVKYFRGFELSVDECSSLGLVFEKDGVFKQLQIDAELSENIPLDINFTLNIGKAAVIYYNHDEGSYFITRLFTENEENINFSDLENISSNDY